MKLTLEFRGNHFQVRFAGRSFIMDEFELLYFLPLAVFNVGPSRAQALMEQAKESGFLQKDIDIKFDTIPAIYMRTQL